MKKLAVITLLSLGTLASTAWAADREDNQAPKASAADIKVLNDTRDDWNKMQKSTNKGADSKADVFSNHKHDSHVTHTKKDVYAKPKQDIFAQPNADVFGK
ncbi:hypothetical protein V6380_16680 [Acinetobacter variabilis]|uniref:hypothetical protein n=1 Tax=Acinetobacter variabilis TaxID=70346 RepID=UPI003B844AFE